MVFNLAGIFLGVVNMSVTACFVILIVLFIRMLLLKTPKVFSYGLWGVVFFRLMCPFSFSSAFSLLRLFPKAAGGLHAAGLPAAGYSEGTVGTPGTGILTDTAPGAQGAGMLLQSSEITQSAADVHLDQGHLLLSTFSMLWLLGAACLLCYGIWSYAKLKGSLSTAMKAEKNVFESESVQSPCVVGFLQPRIYLPLGISGQERQYILCHERIHIRRLDHLLRPLAYFALCLHWFNPLVWLSFRLMTRDMEMSCDERVLKEMGSDIKKAYSSSLLSFAVEGSRLSGSPLAFGEENVGKRIRNILSYRRPPAWIGFAILLFLAVSAMGLLTDPDIKSALDDQTTEVSFTAQELRSMAETWAEALKTRDGEPRYEMMSDKMKEQFIKGQKERSEPWNFNIGVSSPWVESYKVTIAGDTAEIIYTLTDSTQAKYEQKEILHFGKEHGKTVVIQADDLLSDWDRYSYHAPTAEEAFDAYKKALLESDYRAILALTPSAKLDPYGQVIWDTVKISEVSIISQDIRRDKACYELELTVKNGGSSAFESGVSPRWLWLAKDELGWYAEGLMTGGAPGTDWWNQSVSTDPFFGESQWAEATYRFEKLLYLSPLSSSTFEYAENRMREARCIIGADHFSIDNAKEKVPYEVTNPIYVKSELTEKMAADFEESTFGKISVADYSVKHRYKIMTEDNQSTNYCFYVMDSELWLATYADNTADGSEITMALWKLN